MTNETPGPPADEEAVPLRPLRVPADGVPPVTDSTQALRHVVGRFAQANGPVAVDAERASGYRYSQRAYLIQLKREGAGIALIDPIALPDLTSLQDVIGGEEWVLHAASQDLPCLGEVGLHPARVFDTELAARLLGYPRVGLATVVAELLGLGLAKEHSAVDWSQRPLGPDWLAYAALDVEVLLEVRDILEAQLREQGKLEWAHEEFDAERDAPPPPPKIDPWRRLSGIHAIKDRTHLAVARELWQERDRIAHDRDIAPGRVLPDAALIEAAALAPRTERDLQTIRPFSRSFRRRDLSGYLAAIQRGLSAKDTARPPLKAPRLAGPPPAKLWRERDPEAAERLARVRAELARMADELHLPVENLAPPAAIRALCWEPPAPSETEPADGAAYEQRVANQLQLLGARRWQAELVAPEISALLG